MCIIFWLLRRPGGGDITVCYQNIPVCIKLAENALSSLLPLPSSFLPSRVLFSSFPFFFPILFLPSVRLLVPHPFSISSSFISLSIHFILPLPFFGVQWYDLRKLLKLQIRLLTCEWSSFNREQVSPFHEPDFFSWYVCENTPTIRIIYPWNKIELFIHWHKRLLTTFRKIVKMHKLQTAYNIIYYDKSRLRFSVERLSVL